MPLLPVLFDLIPTGSGGSAALRAAWPAGGSERAKDHLFKASGVYFFCWK
jgi:hypothetical protein